MNWQATRLDDYSPPIVRKMRRWTMVGRERILNDDELALIWRAAGAGGQFGAIVRLCLLTAQRRAKVTTMRWADLSDGVWTIATAPG
jgi:integrase